MVIDVNTKIARLIMQSAEALETIVNISPKFDKLRNPIVRKLMAGRTSIWTASKIAGVSVGDFFLNLKKLGFTIDNRSIPEENVKKELPAFFDNVRKDQVTELDVRSFVAAGNDPLPEIMQNVNRLQPGEVLKVTNSFYPRPLIVELETQGFSCFTDIIDDNLVEAYFCKN